MQRDSEGRGNRSEIQVLYEDEDVCVVSKPSGTMVHGDGRTKETTVVDWFLSRAPEARGIGEAGYTQDGAQLERSGIVHRLDRETSGVLVFAKTHKSFEHLKKQFHERLLKKEYRVFVYGTMKEKWGSIDRPIGRSTKDFRLRSAQRGARGMLRSAVTDWELISQSNEHAYLKVLPKTGRTHQIRVHLKAVGRPVVCDTLYAPPKLFSGSNLGFERLALHAYTLTLILPRGEHRTFTAPLPEDFREAEQRLAAA